MEFFVDELFYVRLFADVFFAIIMQEFELFFLTSLLLLDLLKLFFCRITFSVKRFSVNYFPGRLFIFELVAPIPFGVEIFDTRQFAVEVIMVRWVLGTTFVLSLNLLPLGN